MQKIINKLCKATDNFNTIDERFLIDCTKQILSKYKNLDSYLNDIVFSYHYKKGEDYLQGRPATNFDTEKMMINIDIASITNYIEKKYFKILNNLNTKEKVFLDNLFILESLLHQIENLIQQMNKINKVDSTETMLVKISKYYKLDEIEGIEKVQKQYSNYMKDFDQLYQNSAVFYNLNPAERMANIKAASIITYIANNVLNNNCTLLKDFIKYHYLEQKLYGYDNTLSSPLETFIQYKKTLCYDNGFYTIDSNERYLRWNQEGELNKRILYGMILSNNEIKHENDKLIKTKSYQLLKK